MTSSIYSRKQFLVKSVALASVAPQCLFGSTESIHVVRKGDTLSEIALTYGVTISAIKRANNLKSDLIKIGQKLVIPGKISSLERVMRETKRIGVKPNRWNYIVAHHSAIERGNAVVYDKNHRRRGMENGLAYHFVIGNGIDSGDGEIEIGSRWTQQLHGGHVRKWSVNETGIGICLVGNFEKKRPTRNQLTALENLIDYLGNTVLRGKYQFNVHKEIDLNHTVCPGRYFPTTRFHRRFN